MKKCDFPDKCYNCRFSERERMRNELEGNISAVLEEGVRKVE